MIAIDGDATLSERGDIFKVSLVKFRVPRVLSCAIKRTLIAVCYVPLKSFDVLS